MTPKEKAKELFDKFDILISTEDPNWRSECIQCAMVAVDEIINTLFWQRQGDYWYQVKQELEKL